MHFHRLYEHDVPEHEIIMCRLQSFWFIRAKYTDVTYQSKLQYRNRSRIKDFILLDKFTTKQTVLANNVAC